MAGNTRRSEIRDVKICQYQISRKVIKSFGKQYIKADVATRTIKKGK